ncbi:MULTISPECIES: PTS galactitol transporter subunit IIC [Clostridium]|jgi:Phosphotransferase system, galactitol-specific IIC component|uniref:PTS galactitol transporter subunit IIC n=4 Tax=Clostridium TaxID=1485 RepID=A0A0B5QMV6_CLOBE|nr:MULTISPECIES: PTS galactitol transporter subunit IIC [Clostridium]ABR34656.1 PTS system Galactitol-specific IIC component [Clostridium beijerinckii NCIMB 8052]AIU03397.1 PTS system galactitol-specific IIC component [Clostridium beijerinckii ATCC 35702]AJG99596.1 PTS galactitol transporter subunit IIC [Clostridium beijerinckii]AQS05243.1 galactitol permease IIC component [Clostridium beijerinckii]AVK46641.1 PTS galactitol transporter subunit IIC [Clostridium sp. MF28]
MLLNVVQYILNLGPTVMLPLTITIIGIIFGQGFKKAFRSGITIGIGFVGINLVVGLLTTNLGGAAQQMVTRYGLQLSIIDVGWPAAAAISWASPIAAIMIPIAMLVNLVMLATKTTNVVDIDIWNYWHFTAAGASVYVLTNGNWLLAILAGILYEVAVIKIADKTAPMVQEFFGLEGVSLPTGSTAACGLIGIPIVSVVKRIPGIKNLKADPETIQKRFGVFGEPMMMGLILGIVLGILAGYGVDKILQIGISMAGVMFLMPRMVRILMEGLIPVSESVREFLQKKNFGKDRNLTIGLDAAVAVGHPAVIATALVLVPITLFLAVILPGNQVLPFGDLATICFYVAFIVGAAKGNIVHSVISGTIVMALGLLMATNISGFHTQMAQMAQFTMPAGTSTISSLDMGGNFLNWIVIKIFQLFTGSL